MHDLRDWRLQAEIAAVAVDAGVVGEALGVAAEAEGSLVWWKLPALRTSSPSLLRSKPVRGTTLKTP